MKEVGPERARILRIKRRLDPEDQQDEEQFDDQFKRDPFGALSRIGQKQKKSQRNIQKQVSYFGNVIEPFNMRNEQELGEVDADGYFVFKKRNNEVHDAWLDSLAIGDEQQLLEGIQKKVLQNKKIQPVKKAEGEPNDEEEEQSKEDDDEEEEDLYGDGQQPRKKVHLNSGGERQPDNQDKPALTPPQIKYLLSELLPTKTHCAAYLKQLKPQKKPQFKKNMRKSKMLQQQALPDQTDLQEHERILELCNLYIRQTGDHQIMTKTKETLVKQMKEAEMKAAGVQILQENESKLSSQSQQHDKGVQKKSKNNQQNDEDDIF